MLTLQFWCIGSHEREYIDLIGLLISVCYTMPFFQQCGGVNCIKGRSTHQFIFFRRFIFALFLAKQGSIQGTQFSTQFYITPGSFRIWGLPPDRFMLFFSAATWGWGSTLVAG